jgi:hypothetical protein
MQAVSAAKTFDMAPWTVLYTKFSSIELSYG